LGKVIEFYLYQQNFIADKTLSFCGFRKPHPHATDSIIRVAFHNEIDPIGVSGYVQGATDSAISAFKKLVEQLGGDLKKTERVRLSKGMATETETETKTETKTASKSSSRAVSPKKTSTASAAAPDVTESKKDKLKSAQSQGASASSSKPKKVKSLSSGIKLNLSEGAAAAAGDEEPGEE
jgi:DNA-directed RNA polymerase subunit L